MTFQKWLQTLNISVFEISIKRDIKLLIWQKYCLTIFRHNQGYIRFPSFNCYLSACQIKCLNLILKMFANIKACELCRKVFKETDKKRGRQRNIRPFYTRTNSMNKQIDIRPISQRCPSGTSSFVCVCVRWGLESENKKFPC